MKKKTKAALAVAGVAGLTYLWCTPLPANASSEQRFGAWGNTNVDDCSYASMADLVQLQYPTAKITSDEVVQAWRDSLTNTTIPYDDSLTWMETTGLDNHKIQSLIQITTNQQVKESKGVWAQVWLTLPSQGFPASSRKMYLADHDVAVVGSNNKGPLVVMWGKTVNVTWKQWSSEVYQEFQVVWS